jgi:hypothetical protein
LGLRFEDTSPETAQTIVSTPPILILFRTAWGFFDDAAGEKAVEEGVESSGADFELPVGLRADVLHEGLPVTLAFGQGEEYLELGGGKGKKFFRLRHGSIDDRYIDSRCS